jgi:hypothetical protein
MLKFVIFAALLLLPFSSADEELAISKGDPVPSYIRSSPYASGQKLGMSAVRMKKSSDLVRQSIGTRVSLMESPLQTYVQKLLANEQRRNG